MKEEDLKIGMLVYYSKKYGNNVFKVLQVQPFVVIQCKELKLNIYVRKPNYDFLTAVT